jgi:hypothetical protein
MDRNLEYFLLFLLFKKSFNKYFFLCYFMHIAQMWLFPRRERVEKHLEEKHTTYNCNGYHQISFEKGKLHC